MRMRSTGAAMASLLLLGIVSSGCAKKAESEERTEPTRAEDAARRAEDAARRCEAALQRADTAADKCERSMAHRFKK